MLLSSLLDGLLNGFLKERDAFLSGVLFASFLWIISISILFWGTRQCDKTTVKSNRETTHRSKAASHKNTESNNHNPWKTKEAIEHRKILEGKDIVLDDDTTVEEFLQGEKPNQTSTKPNNQTINQNNTFTRDAKRNSFTFSIVQTIQSEKERIKQSLTSQIRERWPWESLRSSKASANSTKSISSTSNNKFEGENEYLISDVFSECNNDEDGNNNNNNNKNNNYNDENDHDDPLINRSDHEDNNDETKSDTCIGSIFGLDCGGTLSKFLYFEHKPKHQRRAKSDVIESSESKRELKKLNENNDTTTKDDLILEDERFELKMNRSHSMFEIASNKEEHQQALDRFYNFVTQLDTYGPHLKDQASTFYSRTLGGEFHFIQFETKYITRAMDLIKVNNLHHNINQIGATGGGAHKFADRWDEELKITIAKQDELDSLVAGMQFILADVVGECYTFKPNEVERMRDERNKKQQDTKTAPSNVEGGKTAQAEEESKKKSSSLDPYWWSKKVTRDYVAKTNSYPYLLVMIGTGVSVLRVDGPRKHERISGSTIGGGTYWGLCRLLTDAEDFESVLALAEQGDPSKVDMMVGDIYGDNSDALKKLGLTAEVVASSFGKLVAKQHPARGLTQGDLARALLLMVTINIGQVALLNAKLYNTSRIFFVGNFLRQNVLSMKRLAFAIHYWSGGTMEALFLEHEGYFGALGAFLLENGIPQPRSSQSKISNVNSETLLKKSRSGSF